MSDQKNKTYYAKVLLFGEYALLKGGKGLAVPYEKAHGHFSFAQGKTAEGLCLKELLSFFKNSSLLSQYLDLFHLERDIEKGLVFDSNIPMGYGVGSSGALCAAILSEYGANKFQQEYQKSGHSFLQDILALMESFYHGTSSGLDPLISYLNRPLLINGKNSVEFIEDIPQVKMKDFFLIDTQMARKTAPLVDHFKKLCLKGEFASHLDSFVENSNRCIEAFFEDSQEKFDDSFFKLSKFQWEHMGKMIPDSFARSWKEGLETGEFFFKLCGAGGGGYLMVYSRQGVSEASFWQGVSVALG